MIVFQYNAETLVLPNATKDEELSVNVKTKFKHAMSGDIWSTRSTSASRSFELFFTEIAKSKYEEVMVFFTLSSGQTVTYIDKDGVSFLGKVVTDTYDFQESGRGHIFDFSFIFEVIP